MRATSFCLLQNFVFYKNILSSTKTFHNKLTKFLSANLVVGTMSAAVRGLRQNKAWPLPSSNDPSGVGDTST